jgi:MtaA/CmuA family methyltransferase
MTRMTAVERCETVLAGGIPDRVPVDLHDFMVAANASSHSFPEFMRSGEALAEGLIASWREYGHDMLLTDNGTATLAEACGVGVELMEDSAPVSMEPAIASLDEIDRLVLPDPATSPPLVEALKATRIVAREVGEDGFVMGIADQGPFSLASMIVGMEEFLVAQMLPGKRAKLHELLDFCEEAFFRFAVAQIEAGAHVTSMGESIAGPDVCSPAIYHEIAWPHERNVTQRLLKVGVRLQNHICGNATAIVPDMVETGAVILGLDYKCDLPAIKAATQGRATIVGTIDPSEIVARGTPDDVTDAAREELAILGPGGGLILGAGCALPPDTPAENIHALVEAGRTLGRYDSEGQLAL